MDADSPGGTDGEGHKTGAKYQIAKNWPAAAACFLSELGLDGSATDCNKLQLNLELKF